MTATGQPHDPAAMLQLLLDEREITGLLFRYCRAMDRCDDGLLRSLYHEDARIEHAGFRGGVDLFLEFVMGKMRQIDFASHHITNVLIEIAGDRAFCEGYFINIASDPDRRDKDGRPFDRQLTGRYLDRLERGAAGWKISHRRVVYETSQLLPPCGPADDPRHDSFLPRGRRDGDDPLYAGIAGLRRTGSISEFLNEKSE